MPDFSNRSIAGISDSLRFLGDLEVFRGDIKKDPDTKKVTARSEDSLAQTTVFQVMPLICGRDIMNTMDSLRWLTESSRCEMHLTTS